MARPAEQSHRRRPAKLTLATLLAVSALALLAAGPALAAPPIVKSVSFSHVGETGATLEATVDPNGAKTTVYHFQYTTLAKFEESGFAGATETADGPAIGFDAEPTAFSAQIAGLQPATAYRFRVLAANSKGEKTESPPVGFSTHAPALAGLPDGRAYEQASPPDKGGNDVTGSTPFVKASSSGNGISFGATSSLPGGLGTQQLPTYLATRTGEGAGASWATQGLLPPADSGQNGNILGWTPDFSRVYQLAVRFGVEVTAAILESRPGSATPTQVTPFVEGAAYAFAGASADGSVAVFESGSAQLGTTPVGVEGRSNVYAWDADGKTLSLVSRMNTSAEDAEKLSVGAFAGPYHWANANTGLGGARSFYYTHDTNAVAADGSVFFTAAGTGHLYQRLNPTEPQSALDLAGDCTEAARACTIDVSASRRATPDAGGPQPAAFHFASADGDTALFTSSEKLTDDATTGPEVPPPAIGRLTLNGSEEPEDELDSYFPGAHGVGVAVAGEHIYWVEPLEGTIARATLTPSGPPIEVDESFIDLAAEETCFETRPFLEPGVEQCGPSIPRYLAVGGEYLYWTNTGPLGGEGNGGDPTEEAAEHAGTIGRAKLDGSGDLVPGSVEPEFITGASDPQGIAVDSEHIYWANSWENRVTTAREQFIARAGIEGDEVEQRFFKSGRAFGLALSATRLYWAGESLSEFNVLDSILLDGSGEQSIVAGQFLQTRGVALAGDHLYWTDQATGTIGRVELPLEESSAATFKCSEIARCEPEFIEPDGAVLGLAADASGSHLYWTANGEVPPHPGNDLYRYQREGSGGCEEAGGCLEDLTVDAADANGAQVLGVADASADASRAYFVANGVLSEAPNEAGEVAEPGTCDRRFVNTVGRCNLYLWEGGEISFIARLNASPELGLGSAGDSKNWLPTTDNGVINGGPQKTAFASADGATLLFRSREKLTPYENAGLAELYLYRLGEGIACVSCDPTEAPPGGAATLGQISYPFLVPNSLSMAALASRNLSAEGGRAFFESPDPLVATDTNGEEGCPVVGSLDQSYPSCLDVYEWEAPGTGGCNEASPGYSPPNQGCLYLISSGTNDRASLFLDASASGDDVFFATRSQLVGQDADQLFDVYDARVGGGIASQSPSPRGECEGEACRPGATAPPAGASPATPGFQGTGNVKAKAPRPCPKGKVRRHGRCVKKHKRHHRKHHRPHRHNRGGHR